MNLKDKVLAELLSAGNQYISGGQLAKMFGVSRTAVWKVIEQLKADGCDIGAVTNRGYILRTMPDLLSEHYMQKLLESCTMDWQVQFHQEVDSTNILAKRLASSLNAPAGTVVAAARQTAGRGRLGKFFHSPSGGLYFSMILRPELPLNDMMAVTACTASAVHLALQDFGIVTQIKWVNDLFLNDRKICGILSEGSFNAELLLMDFLVIGIGINLQPDPHLPEELRPIVTDILTETGIKLHRSELLAAILRRMEEMLTGLPEHSYLPIYRGNSYTVGKKVRVLSSRGDCTALATGIAEDAGLIVRLADGTEEIIRTGTAQIVE